MRKVVDVKKNISLVKRKSLIISLFFSLTLILGFFNLTPTYADEPAQWANQKKTAISLNGKIYTKITDKSKYPKEAQDNGDIFVNQSARSGKTNIISVKGKDDKINGKIFEIEVDALGNTTVNSQKDLVIEGTASNIQTEKTSCAVEGGGGWFVCMVSRTLANAMDGLYNILQDFLKVQPLQISDRSGLYQVWNYMRNIANVLFVMFFTVVIYSQITNIGISNYGIKKMLPKLIVAAILINLSYYICAIAVDISNILGNSLQNLLLGIRKEIFEKTEVFNAATNFDFKGITEAVLAGGSLVVYGTYTLAASGTVGVTFTILIALLGMIYSALVTVIILAARQAIITIIIFLSPLAFAANILPNTDKWYDKWKDIFTTMLIMYPLVALTFGGAQLAGAAIISNANGNFITLVLGMIVQVAPLAITPMIMKVSGNLLGKFAGIINNPNKGPFDTGKRLLSEAREDHINRKIARGGNTVAMLNQMNHNRRSRLANNKSIAEMYQKARFNNLEAEQIDKALNSNNPTTRESILKRNTTFQAQQAQLNLEVSQNSLKESATGLKAEIMKYPLKVDIQGNITGLDESKVRDMSRSLGKSSASLYQLLNEQNARQAAANNNQAMVTSSIAEVLKRDDGLQEISAGVRGLAGRNVSMGQAFAQAAKVKDEETKALSSMINKMGLEKSELSQIINSQTPFTSKDGVKLQNNDMLKSAVVGNLIAASSFEETVKILERTGDNGDLRSIRSSIREGYDKFKSSDAPQIGVGSREKLSANGFNINAVLDEMNKGYSTKGSAEMVIAMSNEVMRMQFSENNIQNMPKDIAEKTLLHFKNINEDKNKYGRIKTNQAVEINKAVNYIEKYHKSAYESAAGGAGKKINLNNIK